MAVPPSNLLLAGFEIQVRRAQAVVADSVGARVQGDSRSVHDNRGGLMGVAHQGQLHDENDVHHNDGSWDLREVQRSRPCDESRSSVSLCAAPFGANAIDRPHWSTPMYTSSHLCNPILRYSQRSVLA